MGLIWDLIQHAQITSANSRSSSLEQRVADLEHDLRVTNEALTRLLQAIEARFGEDLDGDGVIGRQGER